MHPSCPLPGRHAGRRAMVSAVRCRLAIETGCLARPPHQTPWSGDSAGREGVQSSAQRLAGHRAVGAGRRGTTACTEVPICQFAASRLDKIVLPSGTARSSSPDLGASSSCAVEQNGRDSHSRPATFPASLDREPTTSAYVRCATDEVADRGQSRRRAEAARPVPRFRERSDLLRESR